MAEFPAQDEDNVALVSLALIESEMRTNRGSSDRLELFMPLIIEVLQEFDSNPFGEDDVSERLLRAFSLKLPRPVVSTLLKRCSKDKRRYLEKKDGRFIRTAQPLPNCKITERKEQIESRHVRLAQEMVDYAKEKGIECHTRKQARKMLACYLDRHFRSLSIGDVPHMQDGDEGIEWVGRFLLRMKECNSELFDTAVQLVRGRVIYNAAFLPGFSDGGQKFKGIFAYLDSTVVCRALGYGLESEKELMLDAIGLLKESGVTCFVLEQTISEIGRNLERVAKCWGRPSPDEHANSYLYCMMQNGFDLPYVERVASNPALEVESKLGIHVAASPKRIERYVSSEKELATLLADKDGNIGDSRIWHDIDCIAAVLTNRGDRYATIISNAKCFFLTESPRTLRTVNRWWSTCEHRHDIPPIFSLVELANYAWLCDDENRKIPLSKEALAATCAASAQPSEKQWKWFVQRMEAYVSAGKMTPEVARAYLCALDSRAALAELSDPLLDEENLNEGVQFDNLIDEIADKIASQVYKKDYKKFSAAEMESRRAIAIKVKENDDLAKQLNQSEEECERLQEANRWLQGERRRNDQKVKERAARTAGNIVWFFISLGLALCMIAVGVAFAAQKIDVAATLLGSMGIFLLGGGIFADAGKSKDRLAVFFEDRYREKWGL